jgi:hypothetical protein
MASAYLFAMLAVTPSKSREVPLMAIPEFEVGRVAGSRPPPHRRRKSGFQRPISAYAEDWMPRDALGRTELGERLTLLMLVGFARVVRSIMRLWRI